MSSAVGLTLTEQLQHGWAAPFALTVSGSQARPRSPHFQPLAWLEERKGTVALLLSKAALDHPTTAPELERLRWEFLSANLGAESQLKDWLAGPGKDPLKAGERKVELSVEGDAVAYTVAKARSKFWPFS